jgi:hypothetical protein
LLACASLLLKESMRNYAFLMSRQEKGRNFNGKPSFPVH